MKSKTKPKNYVDGKTLHNQLVTWYQTDPEGKTEIPSVIVRAVKQICERLGTSHNFRGYSFIEDMISAGLVNCVIALKARKYDPTRGENPFAYFTQIAHNEFIRIIKEEKRESYIKHKSLEHHNTQSILLGQPGETAQIDDSGRIEALVEKFESKKKKKEPKSEE